MELVVCPKCRSIEVYKLGENFDGEFFECLDCNCHFTRYYNGKIEIWDS